MNDRLVWRVLMVATVLITILNVLVAVAEAIRGDYLRAAVNAVLVVPSIASWLLLRSAQPEKDRS